MGNQKGFREKAEQLLRWAMEETNKKLNLNVKINIGVDFGDSYGEIH
jgi:hypothetical protein